MEPVDKDSEVSYISWNLGKVFMYSLLISTYSHRGWIQDSSKKFPGTKGKPRRASELSSRNLHEQKNISNKQDLEQKKDGGDQN